MCVLQILLLPLMAGNAPLDQPSPVGGSRGSWAYDDGTASWLSWDGLYRGVWFNSDDFGLIPMLSHLEFWFYHHSSYPWDTSSFYAELYNGESAGPATLLDQTSVTALHYALSDVHYIPDMIVEQNWWGVVNTQMSSGGWPSLIGDNTPNWTGYSHSFFSDDFVIWEPWIIQGPIANDYFIEGDWWDDLAPKTWGAIKTLF
jgi:hypothetical protein